jgi:hypothetical protein
LIVRMAWEMVVSTWVTPPRPLTHRYRPSRAIAIAWSPTATVVTMVPAPGEPLTTLAGVVERVLAGPHADSMPSVASATAQPTFTATSLPGGRRS